MKEELLEKNSKIRDWTYLPDWLGHNKDYLKRKVWGKYKIYCNKSS